MKNKIFALLLVFCFLFNLTSFAADTEELNGFYDIGTYQNVDIKPYSGDTEVNATAKNLDGDEELELLYENSDRLEVSYTAATNGGYYGVLLVEGNELPTKDNKIIYINQLTAESNTVDFNVYPMLPKKATPLSLYISSNVQDFELIKVPLNYYLPMPPYVLGDIDGVSGITIDDAYKALRIAAKLLDNPTEEELLAADVANNDGKVTVDDAYKILRYAAKLITSWD